MNYTKIQILKTIDRRKYDRLREYPFIFNYTEVKNDFNDLKSSTLLTNYVDVPEPESIYYLHEGKYSESVIKCEKKGDEYYRFLVVDTNIMDRTTQKFPAIEYLSNLDYSSRDDLVILQVFQSYSNFEKMINERYDNPSIILLLLKGTKNMLLKLFEALGNSIYPYLYKKVSLGRGYSY